MGDVVATAATAAAPVVYGWFLGGLFDIPLAGLPVFFWMLFLGTVLFVIVLVFNWWQWDMCRAVSGHYTSVRTGAPEALKITKNMRMKLVPAVYADQIFEWEDPKDIEKWHLSAPHSVGQLGPVNTAILVDYHDWVDNPLINESIKVCAEQWNIRFPDDQIHHYDKFMAYREDGRLKSAINATNADWVRNNPDEKMIMDAVRVPAYFWINFALQEQYLPPVRDAAAFGGWLMHEAVDFKSADNEEKKNYGMWILGGSVAISILMIIMAFLFASNMMAAK